MTRKKKLSLGQELTDRIITHKICVIEFALLIYDEIYDSELLRDFRDETGNYEEKAEKVTDILLEEMRNGDFSRADDIYKLCWDYVKDDIDDQRSFSLNIQQEQNQDI